MRPSSRSLRRLSVLSISAVCALSAAGSTAALAAPITATAPGHAVFESIPTGSKIKTVRSTVDPDTGVWTTAITFDAAQSAQTASALRVNLIGLGDAPAFGWTADTDPGRINQPQTNPDYLTTGYRGTPGAATSIAFNTERTVLTLTATDPALKGYKPDYVRATTAERSGGAEYSTANAYLGPVAPKTTIPTSARQLTATKGGTIKVPLNALKSNADRRIIIKLGNEWLGLNLNPPMRFGEGLDRQI